jgi:hypothetical protein
MHLVSSAPFAFRARCKKCGSLPTFYLFLVKQIQLADFRDVLAIGNRLLKYAPIRSNSYLKFEPIDFKSLSYLKIRSSFSKIGSFKYSQHKYAELLEDGIADALTCECNKTLWTFKVSEMPHLTHRKSRSELPNGFRLL